MVGLDTNLARFMLLEKTLGAKMKKIESKGEENKKMLVHRLLYDKLASSLGATYICLTVGLRGYIKDKELKKSARILIDSRCVYTVNTGEKCKEMESAIDLTYVKKIGDKKYTNKNIILITSHPSDKTKERIWFFLESTPHLSHNPPMNYPVLFIGENEREEKKRLREFKENYRYKKLVEERKYE